MKRTVFSKAGVLLQNCFTFLGNAELLLLKKNLLFLISFSILLCIDWLKTFELIFIGLTLLLILYIDVNSHVKSVMKVGFREQINYMKFMKVCILVLQK